MNDTSKTGCVILTGAAGGIGTATTKLLIDAGYRVAALDRNESALAKLVSGTPDRKEKLDVYPCDIIDGETTAAVLSEIQNRYGTPWALINNAGVGGPFQSLDQISDSQWQEVMEVKSAAPFRLMRALLPHMAARGSGRIVNVASLYGTTGARLSAAYVAANHALIGLTRAVVAEWGHHGISSNAICPGFIDTSMSFKDAPVLDYEEQIRRRTPAGSIGKTEDVARMILFLVDQAPTYLNGSVINFDGGISADAGIL